MSGPTQTGGSAGETADRGGRRWRWSAARGTWFPTDPQPYETVTSPAGDMWMYHPVLDDWFDPLHFPDDAGTVADAAASVYSAIRTIREMPEE